MQGLGLDIRFRSEYCKNATDINFTSVHFIGDLIVLSGRCCSAGSSRNCAPGFGESNLLANAPTMFTCYNSLLRSFARCTFAWYNNPCCRGVQRHHLQKNTCRAQSIRVQFKQSSH